MGDQLGRADVALPAHLAGEVHEAGLLETLDLVVRELDAHAVPVDLRDAGRERRELPEHVGLIGVDDELAAGPARGAEAADQPVEVLARGGDGDELVRLGACEREELLLDVGLRAQAVRSARRAQRGALAEQPVDAAHALVGEQVLEAEAGAPVCAKVAGVEQALPVGFAEQRPRVRRGVVDGDRRYGRHRRVGPRPMLNGSSSGSKRRSAGSAASGKKTRPTSSIASVPRLPYTGMAGCAWCARP